MYKYKINIVYGDDDLNGIIIKALVRKINKKLIEKFYKSSNELSINCIYSSSTDGGKN